MTDGAGAQAGRFRPSPYQRVRPETGTASLAYPHHAYARDAGKIQEGP